MNTLGATRRQQAGLAALLLLGLLIRLPFMVGGFHAAHDIDTYVRWGGLIQAHGLVQVYDDPEVDYPPLLLYLFGGAAWLEAQGGLPDPAGSHRLAGLIIQTPTALADVLTAGLLAGIAWRRAPSIGLLVAGLYLFNPAIWYVTAFWGQTDSIYTLLLLAAVVALARRALLPAWVLYALALGAKLQSLALAPLLLAWTLAKHGWRGLLGGLAAGLLTTAILDAPWWLAGRGDNLSRAYTLPVEKWVVVTAFNFWYLLLGGDLRVRAEGQPTSLALSYQDWGDLLFVGLAALIVGLTLWRGARLAVPAAAMSLGMFLVLTHIHERHAFPVLAFLAWGGVEAWEAPPGGAGQGAGVRRALPLAGAYGLLTLTLLFNLNAIVPLNPAWGTLAAQPDGPGWVILKNLALVAAALNTLLLVGLIGLIWTAPGRAAPAPSITSPGHPATANDTEEGERLWA